MTKEEFIKFSKNKVKDIEMKRGNNITSDSIYIKFFDDKKLVLDVMGKEKKGMLYCCYLTDEFIHIECYKLEKFIEYVNEKEKVLNCL